jgi:DNA-nicking Smr family endonuclease
MRKTKKQRAQEAFIQAKQMRIKQQAYKEQLVIDSQSRAELNAINAHKRFIKAGDQPVVFTRYECKAGKIVTEMNITTNVN